MTFDSGRSPVAGGGGRGHAVYVWGRGICVVAAAVRWWEGGGFSVGAATADSQVVSLQAID